MTSCAIILSHYKSLPFLEASVRQIRKYANEKIEQHIYIIDQSGEAEYNQIKEWYYCSADITIVKTDPRYSGYGLDFLFRYYNVSQEYIAQIHCDSFPISDKWLIIPITLIKENNLSFVGQLQFINNNLASIYPPNPFFAMAQCYNVARTSTYIEMSMEAGFTRFHNRPQSGLTFKNDDWAQWAKDDYGNRGSDDDVVAFHWEDVHRQHNKLGLAISGMIGSPEDGSSWGRVIDGLIFHFGSAREAIGVMDRMPIKYQEFTKKINNCFTDEVLQELLSKVKPNISTRIFWDGSQKESYPASEDLNKIIEDFKIII